MAEAHDGSVEIVGTSVKEVSRILILRRTQPDRIAVSAYAGNNPITVVVSAEELRAAVNRLFSE